MDRCKVVRFNSGEGLKTEVALILDFYIETRRLQKLVNKLLATPLLLPIKTIDFIDKNIGKFAEFYYGDVNSLAEIQFINPNNFVISFENDNIHSFLEEEELNQFGIKSVEEMFEGDTINNLILTNYRYGQKYLESTEAYLISLKLKGREGEHV
ncbi:hypothetical protein [Paenibacillus sp. FSL R5-0701]|uniref:hypothetical protein n=1 Tax=Paenibacillus sp. FSL R5-0701 TaxID=2921654 RepID=UPI0030CA8103